MSQSQTRKGQTALEFTFMVAMALVISAVFLASIAGTFSDAADQERRAAVNAVGYMIQDEIILATQVEDGYERTFYIPQRAGRFTFEISNSATGVTIKSGSVTITYPLPEMTGTFEKGENIIEKTGTIVVSA